MITRASADVDPDADWDVDVADEQDSTDPPLTDFEQSLLNAGISFNPNDPVEMAFQTFGQAVAGLSGDALRARNELEFYAEWCIGFNNPEYAALSPFLRRVYSWYQYTHEDLLILGPRNSAKSTSISVIATTWTIGNNPLIRILMAVSSMEQQGLAFSRQIEAILTGNERYIQLFNELKPARPVKWTEAERIVERQEPPSGMKDPTFAVVGVDTAVPSKRADQVHVDDIVTALNAYTDAMRRKVVRFVYQTLFPILVPGGRRIMIGSRWDPRDLYSFTAAQWGLIFPTGAQIDFTLLREAYQKFVDEQNALIEAGFENDSEITDQIKSIARVRA